MSLPTQSKHPWRATGRTIFEATLGACAASPLVYQAITQESPELATGAAAAFLGVTSAVTRVMAVPAVDEWLRTFLPWLASDPVRPFTGD